jgi:hypothetical protein
MRAWSSAHRSRCRRTRINLGDVRRDAHMSHRGETALPTDLFKLDSADVFSVQEHVVSGEGRLDACPMRLRQRSRQSASHL